jgi:hypothetical protein
MPLVWNVLRKLATCNKQLSMKDTPPSCFLFCRTLLLGRLWELPRRRVLVISFAHGTKANPSLTAKRMAPRHYHSTSAIVLQDCKGCTKDIPSSLLAFTLFFGEPHCSAFGKGQYIMSSFRRSSSWMAKLPEDSSARSFQPHINSESRCKHISLAYLC